MNSLTCHSTKFMLDLEVAWDGTQGNMQHYIKREPGYDLAFCEAWNKVDAVKDIKLTKSAAFLKLLDKIQQCALEHLPLTRCIGTKHQIIQGRAEINFYGLSKNANSDEQGIKDIIKKLWIDGESFNFITKENDPDKRYVVNKDEFYEMFAGGTRKVILIQNTPDSRQETFEQITQVLIPLYNQGLCPDGSDRMIIYHLTNHFEREKKAIQILDSYFEEIITKESSIEKIKTISATIRDLMQLHLYYDGNGRTLYMFANLLLYQNDLPPFYPRNMCMFDGNSIETMVAEILAGQERFASMFGDAPHLTAELKKYQATVIELQKFIEEHFSDSFLLRKSVQERNFNLLLRQSASNPKNITLLKYLINNLETLDIDIHSKGEKSGNALDVAVKFHNAEAIELLRSRDL